MLDLRDHPPRPVPGRGPILKAPVAHQRGVARSAAWPGEKVLDGPLQDIVGREADGIRHTPSLQRFIEGRESKGRVGADDDGLSPGLVPVNDGRSILSHPSALWTLPGRSVAATQSPSWFKTKRGW
jgi:hypothetical protein